jgi:AraC-like DNA-binding protein
VQVLAVASRAILVAFEALGLDGDELLAEVGLERAILADPDRRIPATAADGLWQAAMVRSRDPDLALHAAERLEFGAYRVIDHLAAHAPTLGRSFERIAAYFGLVDPRAKIEIGVHDGLCSIGLAAAAPGMKVPLPALEYTFAALYLRTRAGLGIDYRPARIDFAAARPSATTEHERVFGCPLRFDAEHSLLLIHREDWDRAPTRSDASLFEVLDQHAALLLAALPPTSPLLAELRQAISTELRDGEASLARVGKRLGMSGRTLQRRLDEQQLDFRAVVDEVAGELAKAYLHDRALGLGEVAFLLGFADQSAFTRAFKRWTGVTPGRWRTQADEHTQVGVRGAGH